MADWVIGDVHGCRETLEQLLDEIAFERGRDTLYFVGDLVNRGPASAAVLRQLVGLGSAAQAVLGNHDLFAIGVGIGAARADKGFTASDLMADGDADRLLGWLRERPFAIGVRGRVIVHAGVWPRWTAEQALSVSAWAEEQVRGEQAMHLLSGSLRHRPTRWDDEAEEVVRFAAATAIFTRMRMLTRTGEIDYRFKGAPLDRADLVPWYEVPHARGETEVVFGHWAAHGAGRGHGWVALDSGCAWGGRLTAYRLDDGLMRSVRSCDAGVGRRDD